MQPIRLDLDVADADADGFLNDATGADPFTTFLNNGATPDGLAHQLNLTSAANLSALTFTVVGTDADDRVQTDAITGPNATTVESTKYFKTLTSITQSATLGANTMDVGWVDEVASPTMGLNPNSSRPAAIAVRQTGTANWKLQTTARDLDPSRAVDPYAITDQEDLNFTDDAAIVNKSASFNGVFGAAYQTAFRIVYNSYSSGAELQVWVNQGK